jgi:hypothetical protein
MFNAIETRHEAAERRRGYNHRIDFTMMYVAHDAFSRDLRLMLEACQSGDAIAEATIETWRFFNHQLHVHHTAEDEALWPDLQKGATSGDHMLLLAEHMQHEEMEALALVEALLGEQGWSAFSTDARSRIDGMGGGATYPPWVLDGADAATRDAVLKVIPLPARALFRRVWEPKHRASGRLVVAGGVDG